MWYESHRPRTLDDYIWADPETRSRIEGWIAEPLKFPSLIFEGSTGTGKTTLALLIREILDLGTDCKIMWSSLQSGVEAIREDLQNFCNIGGFHGMKLVIMDEADRLSVDAQEMMRNIIDRYKGDVRFIFTCNNINGISEPIQGRCWVIKIQELDTDSFTDRLLQVAMAEGVDLDDAEQLLIIQNVIEEYYPNMRKAISSLQFYWDVASKKLVRKHAMDFEEEIQSLLADFSVDAIRTFVSGLKVTDYDGVYRCLYNNPEWYTDGAEAILIIAEYLYRHAHAGLPDINLAACLIKLREVV